MPRFGPNVVIDGSSLGGDAHRYEAEVLQQLTNLLIFRTGDAVIAEIWRRRHRVLRIVPWRGRDVNATSGSTDDRAATPRGLPVRDGEDGHHNPAWGHGTGRGSSSRINYTPFIFGSDMGGWSDRTRRAWVETTGRLPPEPGADRGEVLLHEMVHSLQSLTGTLTNAPMGGRWDTVSEFNAIIVTNIYSSERGRWARSGHQGNRPARDPLSLWSNPKSASLLNELRKRLPELVARLAIIATPFNPFSPSYPGAPRPVAPGAAAGVPAGGFIP